MLQLTLCLEYILQTAQLTYDEQYLHGDVTNCCAASHVIVVTNEAYVVGHCHSNIKCGKKNQPIPPSLECTVVK